MAKDGAVRQYLTAAHYVQDLRTVLESNDNFSIKTLSGNAGCRSKTYRSSGTQNDALKSLYPDRNVGIGSALSYQERIRTVFSFTEDFGEVRLKYSALKNHYQYRIAHAVMSVDISEKPLDISALIAFTGMNRSTTYDVLRKMEKSDLVEVYELSADKRRKYIRATETLKSEFFQFLID
ncbi:MAG: MarR family winged helix-turn-helix transcriptional regulator, partial [Sneathiella sp.]